tara:strand:- start:1126 stop:1275 length:150 start_codon:yes stop_codon:yes gene_type:complete
MNMDDLPLTEEQQHIIQAMMKYFNWSKEEVFDFFHMVAMRDEKFEEEYA